MNHLKLSIILDCHKKGKKYTTGVRVETNLELVYLNANQHLTWIHPVQASYC